MDPHIILGYVIGRIPLPWYPVRTHRHSNTTNGRQEVKQGYRMHPLAMVTCGNKRAVMGDKGLNDSRILDASLAIVSSGAHRRTQYHNKQKT